MTQQQIEAIERGETPEAPSPDVSGTRGIHTDEDHNLIAPPLYGIYVAIEHGAGIVAGMFGGAR